MTISEPTSRLGNPSSMPQPVGAVLFDRDGTLVVDVPYNGDASRVDPMPGARRALDRLRGFGIAVAVVSNQSGVADGRITLDDVHAVNRRIDDILGPFAGFFVCAHGRAQGCDCRKPEPGLLRDAARTIGVPLDACVMVGDIGSDIGAGARAGMRTVLVPTRSTRREEVDAAPCVARDLMEAVEIVLRWNRRPVRALTPQPAARTQQW